MINGIDRVVRLFRCRTFQIKRGQIFFYLLLDFVKLCETFVNVQRRVLICIVKVNFEGTFFFFFFMSVSQKA